MNKVAIIGFGRFGKVLHRLLKDNFDIVIFDGKNFDQVYNCDTVFFCVPISQFEKVIREHKKHFRDDQLLIDVLSVKMHPKKVFEKFLRGIKTQALLTHPMFGPDSSKNGFENLPIIIDKFKANEENFVFWKKFFLHKKLNVIEMTAEEHDKLAARSQGLTHFIGRLLQISKFTPTTIDSIGSKKLQEVVDQTCNDTWQLFLDLQTFNPFTKSMRLNLGKSYDQLFNQLLPKRVNKKHLVFGIQGGVGSFNEQAIHHYLSIHKITKFKIKYLFTSERVLKELHAGNIDFGQFAIHNSVSGVVAESIHAMAKFKFRIIEEFFISIQHCLMKLPGTEITTIMAHSQNFLQCKNTLNTRFPNLILKTGAGNFMDTANAANALGQGKMPKTTAILGPKILAKIFGLEIVAENLQDDRINNTSFLIVSR